MTSAVGVRAEQVVRSKHLAAPIAVAAGCVLLAARPALVAMTAHPTTVLVGLFSALLVAGLAWPGVRRDAARLPVPIVVVVGTVAFVLGRVVGGGHSPRHTLAFVAANSLAAVAEEAWFRRLCYDLLLEAGPLWAVAGTAVLFAAVHLGVYGAWVLPLDLAAGLILGWQRWSTGSWHTSAVTHVLANLLVVM
jgi:hypothetical protein